MNQKPFIIKRNDTLPDLQINIKTRNCINAVVPFNLSAVTACTFSMIDECGSVVIASNKATVVNPTAGTVQYTWLEGDTSISGKYQGEFELFFDDGKKISIPSLGGIEIFIDQDINNL
jgi:hypothetical protein